MPKHIRIAVPDAAAMGALGQGLAAMLGAGDCLLLSGDLGAGKTTLARGLITALTGETEVPSPTYTLIQTYSTPAIEVWHADLYRLDSPRDIHPLGLLDVRDEVVSLIEWPDRLGELTPPDALRVDIAFDGDGRTVTLNIPDHTGWAPRLQEAGFGDQD